MSPKSFGFLVVLSVLTLVGSRSAQAATTPTVTTPSTAAPVFDSDQITQFQAILRTTTPRQKAFVAWTAGLVNQGALSATLFESTFLWAKKKPANYRFQYFRRALVMRASDAGVDLSHPPTKTKT
jgi:hypothetical protein